MSDMTLNEVHRFPSAPRTALETLTGYGWLVSAGNVQSRPTKGDSSLGILFENPLKLHTHSLAYTLYV